LILRKNIPLYNFFLSLNFALLILLAISFALASTPNNPFFLIPLPIAIVLFLIFGKKQREILARGQGEFEKLQEKINLLTKDIEAKKGILHSLPRKRQRALFLFNVSQNLIELIDPEDIFDFFANNLGDLFPQADSILIFDFDSENDSLSLVRSLKREDFIVKEKMGDALDKWVLRHNRSLLIEDLTKEFRFDYNKVGAYEDRGASSFIISPLSIAYRVLAVARIEARDPLAFSLDDSRLLRNICDLGAVVLERARLIKHAQDLAIKDSLTSLYVKEYFFERLEQEVKRIRAKGAKLGIIMLDIDDFKKINDTYGHIVGDAVLTKLARILKNIAGGAGNVISRFGGEEFIISIVECTKEELMRIAEDIRESVEKTVVAFRRKKINFTISQGAVLYPDDGGEVRPLIDKVDKLLYKAKRSGKNKTCFSG
jgi:diguanylate cyclase (GGDEF)-like protein